MKFNCFYRSELKCFSFLMILENYKISEDGETFWNHLRLINLLLYNLLIRRLIFFDPSLQTLFIRSLRHVNHRLRCNS